MLTVSKGEDAKLARTHDKITKDVNRLKRRGPILLSPDTDLTPYGRVVGNRTETATHPAQDRQVLSLGQETENQKCNAAWYLANVHIVPVHMADVSVKSTTNLHASNVAEKSLDPQRLAPLNNCHVVQLKELDDEFDPLQVGGIEASIMRLGLCTRMLQHRLRCLHTGATAVPVR